MRAEAVAAARAHWTRQLVELGGPNTLLWYRDLPVGTVDLTNAHLGARNALVTGERARLSELVRDPQALEDAGRRVERVHDTAALLEYEHGIRTCFLGIGTASWTVVLKGGKVAPREPAAPVFLRSCTLRPVDARRLDWLLEPGDELETNPALVDYLASAHGIHLDTDRLEALATAAGGVDPYPAYAALGEVCAGVPDFAVTPRVVLTTFPYYKAPLVADLAAQADTLERHDVVAALAGHADALPAVSVGSDLETVGADADALVLPADAAQREAVAAARAGSHLFLRTPPGTGASQTVANLVAALAGDGQRVLLVSPKRASVETVLDRLASVGLGDLVLDLPDGGYARGRAVRTLVETLDHRLREASTRGDDAGPTRDDEVTDAQRQAAHDLLEAHVHALHGRREPWATTVHEIQEEVSRHARLDTPPRSRVRVAGTALARLDRETLDHAEATLEHLAAVAAWDGDGVDDPWFGAAITTQQQTDEARERVARLAEGGVAETRTTLAAVFRGIHLPAAPTVLDWHRVLATVGRVRDTLELFRPEVFDIPLGDLVAATGSAVDRRALGSDLGALDRWRVRRQARGLLRPGRPPADLHAALAEAHAQRGAWRELAGSGGRPEIPVELDRAQVAHDSLVEDLAWLDAHLPPRADGSRLVDLDLVALEARVATLHADAERLAVVADERRALDALGALGLAELVEDLRARRVPAARVATELRWVWWCSLADEVGAHDPRIAGHDGPALAAAADVLARSEQEARARRPDAIRRALAEQLSAVRRGHPEQEAELRGQAGRARRPGPLPALVRRCGELVTAARPCWAMSPLSVPSVLPPGELFDVVVIEEASLLTPAEAVAAVSRGRRVVVVGDALQLPPSPFVVSAGVDAPEDDDDLSVVDLLDGVLPTRRLSRHYRAHDERLVAFVDDELYAGGLATVPGADTAPVVHHELVEGHGVVAEGEAAVESTDAEVQRVVQLVLRHARTRPERSLGVIVFSAGHRRRVTEAVHAALSGLDERDLMFFDPQRPEAFAVREADHVQGQAWDDVILSVGFGKTPHGRVLHRFGPLGTDTGHRRLGVALTRARRGLVVVSTITADELDPDRLRTPGSRLLRALLEHVGADGDDAPVHAPEGEGRSVVLGDLARRLRSHGLVVHEDYGSSSAPVELAVEDPTAPGTMLVAVDSDGPDYAATPSVADRDRVRAAQLEARGWRYVRVWSTGAFRDPARDVSRILEVAGVRRAPGG
ncbi:hypothetical protein ASG78_02475 [Nostocoides sp. Soil756]|nr:hypothetical protein ASG78_02475 [Tetrasphaera sp. Soil756]